MKFAVRSRNGGYGGEIKRDVIDFLEKNGAKATEKIEPGCDFVVVAGGDGSLLRDQPVIDCPVLGINPGKSVGYYMKACSSDYKERLLALLNGKEGNDYYTYSLMRLGASVNGRKMPGLALNDILVSPVFVRRIFDSCLKVNGNKSTERNSGIIVYTPTGSHAFAHSAGAGKLKYDAGVIGVVALAPYSGSLKKGEIAPRGNSVEIECLSDRGEVCMDGSEELLHDLEKGDKVTVKKSDKPLKLVGFKKRFG